MHPVVPLVQALAKHIEQLVALPDELRATTLKKYRKLCDSCGCHNKRELAVHLAVTCLTQYFGCEIDKYVG